MMTRKKQKTHYKERKEEFLKNIDLPASNEEEKFLKAFLDNKGIEYHNIILDYIREINDLEKKQKIDIRTLNILCRYDKRIRNILYKYLSAFEEYIRAHISNHYADTDIIEKIKEIFTSNTKAEKILKKIEDEGLFTGLLALSLGELINLSFLIDEDSAKELYGQPKSDVSQKNNLDAIRELRNAVSHHKLIFAHEFKSCTVNGAVDDSLPANIKNVHQFLPDYYKEFFKDEINEASEDKESSGYEINGAKINRSATFSEHLIKAAIIKI